eukprot:5789498-Pyramimonas_sp.AAC.1
MEQTGLIGHSECCGSTSSEGVSAARGNAAKTALGGHETHRVHRAHGGSLGSWDCLRISGAGLIMLSGFYRGHGGHRRLMVLITALGLLGVISSWGPSGS